jgi:hypothetical protein
MNGRAARLVVAALVVALLAPGVGAFATHDPTNAKPGIITGDRGQTVVGIQGFHFRGGSEKTQARLVSIDDDTVDWQYSEQTFGETWFYDVDPLANGNFLATTARNGQTIIFELDPDTRERVWTERFDIEDTHDADLLPNGDLVVANMRATTDGVPDDKVFIYNRTTDERTWEWRFRDHYPESTDGGYDEDWTHVNDVDYIGDDQFLLSPRNFDQAIVVNRSTGDIDMRLGSDGDYDTLHEQHNPDYLTNAEGTPTLLVADSENDRIVEYEREGDGWNRTWTVGTEGSLNWPRDADRLPNGNTLVTDSLNHRVIEITPTGEIVWEYYVTWGPYDAERVGATDDGNWTGGSARSPTIADLNATGSYAVSGSANDPPIPGENGPSAFLDSVGLDGPASTWDHVVPWVKPVWASGWTFLAGVVGLLLGLAWGIIELWQNRDRLRRLG